MRPRAMLLHVSREAVFAELERDPRFARKMLAGLSRRLHGLIADVESYSLQSGTQRVIGYLLRQDEELAGANTSYAIKLPTSKAVAAIGALLMSELALGAAMAASSFPAVPIAHNLCAALLLLALIAANRALHFDASPRRRDLPATSNRPQKL